MRVARDDLWLCVDCTLCAVNGDTSGIDDPEREQEVIEGVASLGPYLCADFDGETGEGHEEFSHRTCEACASPLAGEMHRFATLQA